MGRLIPSAETGWPQWRGRRRDGISDETGLLATWPEGGPTLLWTASGLGRGYSSPIISGGRLYITGDVGADLAIFALDLAGKPLWQAKNGQSWRRSYPGARASCLFDEGRLYHMNAHGRVICLNPSDGKEVWVVDTFARFGGRRTMWGIAECLLIDGSRVIVTPGGTQAVMAALDKATGETVWTAEPLRFERTTRFGGQKLPQPMPDADKAGYTSPILFELGGRRLIAQCSARHAFGVDAETGKLLWTVPMPTRFEVLATTPALIGDAVFATGPDGHGGKLVRIQVDGDTATAEEVWRSELDTCQGCVIYVDGAIYGPRYRGRRGWICIDAKTGKQRYELNDLAKGSALYADGRLYCLSEEGEMALLEPTPEGFQYRGRFTLTPQKKKDVWPHPVILDGRLYLRYHDTLHCYDIKAK